MTHCIFIFVISVMINMTMLTKYVDWGFGILGNAISRAQPPLWSCDHVNIFTHICLYVKNI